LRYLSVCSGIEAATVAWHPLGWTAAAYSEIEKFPSQVLAHHYPNTPNVGDMTKFKEWNIGSIDLLVGGTPCQSFSVAGLRKGLDDPRGNLMLTYLAIADQYRPRWLVWENVPGVLSSNGGKDFGVFLGALGELGYGFAYRILDAQYFGVAQRRRRVFVVGYLGDWRAAAAVLFERHSLSGDSAPSREKRKEVAGTAGTLTANCGGLNRPAGNANELDFCIPYDTTQITSKANYSRPESGDPCHPLAAGAHPPAIAQPILFSGQMSNPQTDVDMTQTLQAKNPMAVCLMDQGGSVMNIENDLTGTLRRETHGHEPIVMHSIGIDTYNGTETGQVSCTITADVGGPTHSGPKVMQSMAVRRLTPVECERLQGFPDNYTDIQIKGKATPDGPRYKALGNSMAVPVMAWIGKRIQEVENLQCKPNK